MVEIWQRPASITFPRIWNVIEGNSLINGRRMRYSVSDIEEDKYGFVLQTMAQAIFGSEFSDSSLSVVEAKTFWLKVLNQKLSLACYALDGTGNYEMACIWFNWRYSKHDTMPKFNGKRMRNMWKLREYVFYRNNPFDHFKISEMVIGVADYVFPKFAGDGLDLEMFKFRGYLCNACGITLSMSFLSTELAQEIAKEAGFKDFTELSYGEVEQIDRSLVPPDIHYGHLLFKLMYKLS